MINIKLLFKHFRENVNIKLYDSKNTAEKFMDKWSLFMVIAGFFSYLQYHGFPENEFFDTFLMYSFETLIGLQILKFLLGYIYTFKPRQYIKNSPLEFTLVLIALFSFILQLFNLSIFEFIGNEFNFQGEASQLKTYVEQLFFLSFLFIEIARVSLKIPTINLSPPLLLLSSFLGLIFLGSILLILPKMTVGSDPMPYFDALFTSISASCVTGLAVVDTATYFTVRGQFVILLLIQLGGLNIISFATLFALMLRRNVGIKHQAILQDNFSIGSIRESKTLLRKVFLFSFIIELTGAVILFFVWGDNVDFANSRDRVFNSIFHSISAFNNAGFSIFPDGLYNTGLQGQRLFQLTISFLIIFGGMGFTVLHEIFSYAKIKDLIDKPWKKFSLNSKIGLYTSFVLLVLGTIAYFFLEQQHTLKGMNLADQFVTAFFQSVTTRTAGFNTIDIGAISVPMTIFMLMLMYIGASPASTGGGIKTNTFTVLFMSAYSTLRGNKFIELNMQTISFDSVNKALLIFLFSVSVIFISVFALTITDSNISILDLVFEEVSAFATVGLSRGITGDLSTAGRIVIMTSMFVGRVGLLTLGYALSKRTISTQYTYPKASIIIG
ncbi:MAG: hypothetical protein KAH10_08110 [Flavobacteriales bacterium]|nr:hypothetical protein [Flavobacteriales bacterium]